MFRIPTIEVTILTGPPNEAGIERVRRSITRYTQWLDGVIYCLFAVTVVFAVTIHLRHEVKDWWLLVLPAAMMLLLLTYMVDRRTILMGLVVFLALDMLLLSLLGNDAVIKFMSLGFIEYIILLSTLVMTIKMLPALIVILKTTVLDQINRERSRLCEITPRMAPRILSYCQQDRDVLRYQQAVAEMGRSLLRAEYQAMKAWVKDRPQRIKAEKLKAKRIVQSQVQNQAMQAVRAPVAV